MTPADLRTTSTRDQALRHDRPLLGHRPSSPSTPSDHLDRLQRVVKLLGRKDEVEASGALDALLLLLLRAISCLHRYAMH
jgi:hypothetical protein